MDVSVVVIGYNMARELPRTLDSLSAPLQRIPDSVAYEIICVDNGSTDATDWAALEARFPAIEFHRVRDALPSPVRAVNEGLERARGRLIGLWIDGARLASPGIIEHAVLASRLSERPVIGTLGLHLGPKHQQQSMREGYNQAVEDKLLNRVAWRDDPYRLFEISSFAQSSRGGWFLPMAESNAVFLTKDHWRELGGFDPRFTTPGGGYANLDLWKRAVESAPEALYMLLGEGTFHQFHGGVSTNNPDGAQLGRIFRDEYQAIRGGPFAAPLAEPTFLGKAPAAASRALSQSVVSFEQAVAVQRHFGGPLKAPAADKRGFCSDIGGALAQTIQSGVMKTRYRGVPFLKSPFDMALYLQLLDRLKPATIIEIGCKFGGSALWFADMMQSMGHEARVVAFDIDPRVEFEDARITVLQGDAARLDESGLGEVLAGAPRPWLVVEDSAHTRDVTLAVLRWFDDRLEKGDYIVVEDGVVSILDPLTYGRYDAGPNRAVAEFMLDAAGRYAIDRSLCDFYGHNVSYNFDGWLRRL